MNKHKTELKKIKILHVLYDMYIGGAEILLLHLICSLGMSKFEHHVYYFGSDGPVIDKIEALGVPVYKGKSLASIKQPIRFIVTFFSLVKDLSGFIKRRRIQILLSHLRRSNQLSVTVGKLLSVPAFPTVHNTMEFVDRRSHKDLRVHLNKIMDWLIYKLADRVIAVSPEIKRIIHKKFNLSDSRVVVVKNGIVGNDSAIEQADFEREFSGSKDKLKLLAVGRLTYQKNFEVLIKAARFLVDKDFKDFIFLIIGEGEDRLKLERLILDLEVGEYVRLLGLRHDVLQFMKSSNLLVMPSRYEGLSIAMIEAMACGLPIIGTKSPGLRDYIKDGQNGVLFPVGDDKALSERILELARSRELTSRLSRGARKTFEAEYDMRKNIQFLDLQIRKYLKRKRQ